ncbi:universal stress protein [Candidatus Nitrosotenuis uzonensis]|uniref:Putative Universal stress protein YxiE n=1 Tax=Candidatus Nitrosotenuis uzonensis TaxID=1407055 RepID=A0A812F1G9_9ARCH|nr:universal stress protein [Candidatus Nitrosotenuis uzonensis]CAE6487779.1 putative Universal stress protein YxiE [Candidatus Nitrosotenuis uzonensis]
MFKDILVPYDNSTPSQNALKIASDIARSNNATVHLLYVIQEVMLPNYFGRTQLNKTMKEYEKEIYNDLKAQALSLLQEQKQKNETLGISTKIGTAYGNTSKQILESIKKNKIDLVVIGTTSRKGISKIRALGSVARKISEESPCPVLLVH